MNQKTSWKPLLLTALAPLIWSTGGFGVRILDLYPVTILFWRSLFTALTLLIWSGLRYRKGFSRIYSENLKRGWPVGLLLALSFVFYIFSVTGTTVAASLLIQGTAPMFIVLLGWIVLHDIPGRITISALACVVVGIAIIVIDSLSSGGFSGNVFGLLKALSFAAGTVMIRRIRNINHLPATASAAAIAAISASFMGPQLGLKFEELAILLYLGIIQLGVAFIIFVTWSGKLRVAQTGLLVVLEAILGPIWPWLLLNEKPPNATFIGGALIIAALVLHSIYIDREGRLAT